MQRRTYGLPAGPTGFGFDSLSDEGCARLLLSYSRGIEDIEAGRTNFACGGYKLSKIRKWHRELTAEIASRT